MVKKNLRHLGAALHDATEPMQFLQARPEAPDQTIHTQPIQIEQWSIVVAGQLDPRYHHPFWYHQIELISQDERDKALQGNPIFNPGIAIFGIPDFQVIVQPDSWQIQTFSKNNCERILRVASVIFTRLWDVPVIAYGINCQLLLETKSKSVTQFLADRMAAADLGFPVAEKANAKFIWASESGDFVPNFTLSASPFSPSRLIVTFNGHHPIHEKKHFDLAEKMNKVAVSDWNYAQDVGRRIVEKINKESVVANGNAE